MSTNQAKTGAHDAATNPVGQQIARDTTPQDLLQDIANWIEEIQIIMGSFVELTEGLYRPGDRRRKMGSGIRRYGFIDKTSDLSALNPQFAPAMFSSVELKKMVRELEAVRNFLNASQQLTRVVNDCLLLLGDQSFSMALLYYNSVKELARRNVAGAEAVYRALEPFFKRPRRPDEEPTEPEVERDVRALLHGKKEGKIVVENVKPHVVGGKHVVVDETHREKAAWKETEEGEMS